MISMENLDDEDPDYAIPGPSNAIQNFHEETARKNKEKIIIQIVNKEFTKEIETKEKEIVKIQNRLDDALKTLHFLRTVIVNDYYNKKHCQPSIPQTTRQTRLHPAVKKLIGKSPKSKFQIPDISIPSTSKLSSSITSNDSSTNTKISSNNLSLESLKNQGIKNTEKRSLEINQSNNNNDFDPPKKIPRYIPPKKNVPDPLPPSRGERYKMAKRIIVGNFATLLPDDSRHDSATHKWQVYVNGPKEEPDISKFVSKVKFFLDPSYKPNDVVTVTNRPFNLTRRGWGEFPIRITLYFHDPANKSRDIVYNLKLFKNNPSRQGPVAENWYDIYIFRPNISDTVRDVNNHEKLITNYDKNINDTSIATDVNKLKNDKINRKIQTVSHVQYEHDYVNFISLGYKLEYKGEKHVTISHSPTKINQVNKTNDKLINVNNKNLANSRISVKQINCLNSVDENANKNCDMINIKIDPSKSLMLNSNSNIPALKIVDSSDSLQPLINNNNLNGNHVNGDCSSKIINGKNKVKISDRAQYFNGILESLENIEIKETEALIRFIAKRIPLVTEYALDPDYRKIHPYAVEDEEEFLSYNTGKQRAIELYRAKMIRSILRKKIPEEQVWTLKELMIWCRYHGFTPVWPSIDDYHNTQKSSKLSGKSIQQENKELIYNTCTEPVELHEWIKTSKNSQNNNLSDDELIDIESLDIKDIKIEKTDSIINDDNKRLLELEMPKEITGLHTYVCQTVRQIGVKFGSEEIVTGVSHPVASHLLAKIAEKLMEDLLRISLARAFERNPNKSCPESLTLDDVRSAILSRDEFDIFTNSGLGTQQIDE
ncbi:YEATS domain-containing protein 2-like [Aphidius gifuensis]|uniref:YEATS domain-containing protein 2-like n=1 Tax=Aphidius gifuensis TaxID=684658 RepID=UPI001CDD5BF0|nr:YEATS domain-containing protein 2-like [Aphidius gifuensis]